MRNLGRGDAVKVEVASEGENRLIEIGRYSLSKTNEDQPFDHSQMANKLFARVILEGDLVGRPEQGIKIVQIDHLMATHNQVNFTDEPTVEKQGVCYAVINGHKGLGQYILTCTMEKAIAG